MTYRLRNVKRLYRGRGWADVLVVQLRSGKTVAFRKTRTTGGISLEDAIGKPSLCDFWVEENGTLLATRRRSNV